MGSVHYQPSDGASNCGLRDPLVPPSLAVGGFVRNRSSDDFLLRVQQDGQSPVDRSSANGEIMQTDMFKKTCGTSKSTSGACLRARSISSCTALWMETKRNRLCRRRRGGHRTAAADPDAGGGSLPALGLHNRSQAGIGCLRRPAAAWGAVGPRSDPSARPVRGPRLTPARAAAPSTAAQSLGRSCWHQITQEIPMYRRRPLIQLPLTVGSSAAAPV